MWKRTALLAVSLTFCLSNPQADAQQPQSKWTEEIRIVRPVPCPLKIAQACAAMAAAETDTCFQYACEVQSTKPQPGQPAIIRFACVQTAQPQGSACHDPGACVTAGACSATGGCQPTQPENQISCSQTCAAQNDDVACLCLQYQCYGQSRATGEPAPGDIGTWCTKGTGQAKPQQNCPKSSGSGIGARPK